MHRLRRMRFWQGASIDWNAIAVAIRLIEVILKITEYM